MRVLLTNDDGMGADGLTALTQAFQSFNDVECWVVAPSKERSACSHSMTLGRPLYVQQLGRQRFQTSGSTADCVYFALFGCMDEPPDVVVSGINKGPNLGSDVIYSGTVAGAREAAVRGISGIAVSLVAEGDLAPIAQNVVQITRQIAAMPAKPILVNLNYPSANFSGPVLGPLGKRKYPEIVQVRTNPLTQGPYYWLGGPKVKDHLVSGTDAWLVDNGYASATLLKLDQTDFDPAANQALPFYKSYEEI